MHVLAEAEVFGVERDRRVDVVDDVAHADGCHVGPLYGDRIAGSARRSTVTSGSSRSTSRGSITPAPTWRTDSAPQAVAKRRQSSAGRPAYRPATYPARKASPAPIRDVGSRGAKVTR